jgi:hypothetical protein
MNHILGLEKVKALPVIGPKVFNGNGQILRTFFSFSLSFTTYVVFTLKLGFILEKVLLVFKAVCLSGRSKFDQHFKFSERMLV